VTDARRRSHLRHETPGVDGGREIGAEDLDRDRLTRRDIARAVHGRPAPSAAFAVDHPAIGDGRFEYGELRIGHGTPMTDERRS